MHHIKDVLSHGVPPTAHAQLMNLDERDQGHYRQGASRPGLLFVRNTKQDWEESLQRRTSR